jgi:peroxiredoxin
MASYGIPTDDVPLLPAVGGRSAFVVDADSIIRYAWYAPEGGGMPPIEDILEAVRQLPERARGATQG